MKKILAATSAIVLTNAISASNVTLYGVMDTSIGKLNTPGLGIKTDSWGLISGKSLNTGTSRFGMRGIEDLGGGWEARFQLEDGFDMTKGTTGLSGGQFFSRQSNVSLKGPIGEILLGRGYNAAAYALMPWEMTVIGLESVVANQFGVVGGGQRDSNMILYKSPIFSGFSFVADVVPKGDASYGTPENPKGKYDISASYVSKSISIGAGYNKVQDGNEAYTVGGAYDFGKFKLAASWNQTKLDKPDASGNDILHKGYSLGGQTRFGKFFFMLDVAHDTRLGDTDVVAEGRYSLSKRTFLYTIFFHDGKGKITATNPKIPGTNLNSNINGYSIGIRHNF